MTKEECVAWLQGYVYERDDLDIDLIIEKIGEIEQAATWPYPYTQPYPTWEPYYVKPWGPSDTTIKTGKFTESGWSTETLPNGDFKVNYK